MPVINSIKVTHLLWADDLVRLALNPESLHKILSVLYAYCQEWGLVVNIMFYHLKLLSWFLTALAV